jgi:hypothetical protein
MLLNAYEIDAQSINGGDTPAVFGVVAGSQAQGHLSVLSRWLSGVLQSAQVQSAIATLFKGFTPIDNPLVSRMPVDGLVCFVPAERNSVSVPAAPLRVDIAPELFTE